MTPVIWQPLLDELNLWADAGLTPQFWWRDDDASKPGPMLKKLAEASKTLPVCLAVVPDWLTGELAPWLDDNFKNAFILQHGFAHKNHAKPGQKKSEFSDNRPLSDSLNDIAKGDELLKGVFKNRYQPIFVPPWNRISDNIAKHLNHKILSVYGTRNGLEFNPIRINTHVDIINWRRGKTFIGTGEAIGLCVDHLVAKRLKSPGIDITEPTGILTHHMDHDAGCWQFLLELVEFSHKNETLKWVTPNKAI